MRGALPLTRLPASPTRPPMALRFVVFTSLVSRLLSQDGGTPPVKTSFAAAAFPTTMQCRVSLQNMLYNDDWRFMNDTMTKWCRIRVENKMSTCCTNAEFAKGKADSCSDCKADCVFTRMAALCNEHFGKACVLTRKPFSKNNVSFEVAETFCVPTDCDNAEDLGDNLLIRWYDAQYRYERSALWMKDYADAEDIKAGCPNSTVAIIIGVVVGIIVVVLSIPLGLFLFKAPKERGRVLRGVDDEDDHHEETPVENMAALPDASGTMGSSGFGGGAPKAIGNSS